MNKIINCKFILSGYSALYTQRKFIVNSSL